MDFGNIVSSSPSTGEAPPMEYGDVLDKYRQHIAKFPHLDGKVSVPEFSQAMNESTGTNQYSAGLGDDNMLRRAGGDLQFRTKHLFGGLTGGADTGFNLPQAGQDLAEGGARAVGLPEQYVQKAGEVGRGMAPLPLDLGIAALTGPAAPYTLGGLMGARTYADTGSKTAGAIAAFTPKILEGAGNLAEQGTLKAVGGSMRGLVPGLEGETIGAETSKLVDAASPEIQKYLSQYVGTTSGQKAMGLIARQAGMLLGFEGVGAGTDVATGNFENLKHIADPVNLFGTALGQLPFAAMDAAHIPGGRRETGKMLDNLKETFRTNAATQFEKQTGRKPSEDEVNSMLERAQGAPTGTTLPSKVDVSWSPLHTSDGEVPMQDAVEQARKAMQLTGNDAHETTVAMVLRGMAEHNPHWTRDELVGNAAAAIPELDRTDSEQLSKYGMSRDEQQQLISEATDPAIVRTKEREKQITDATKADPSLQQLMGEVVAKVHPKRVQKEAKFGELDQEAGRQTEGTSPELDEATGTSERMVIGTGELAEADYAMRDVVEKEYTKAKASGVDTTSPDWQQQVMNKVRLAMKRAKLSWSRNRSTEETAGTFDSEADARAAMSKLQEEQPRDKPASFTVEQRNGKWNVNKQNFHTTHSIEGEHERTSKDEGTMEADLQADMKEQMGVSAEHLQKLGETPSSFAAMLEPVEHAFKALEAIKDPGTREGARSGITHNILDAFSALSAPKLEELILNGRTETESGRRASVQDKATKQARMVAYIQFLRDGGKLDIKSDKSATSVSARATDADQLENFNNYVRGKNPALAFSDGQKWNTSVSNGLNFFEQFRLVSDYIAKNFVDLRDVSRRIKGDMVMLPRGVTEKNIDNVLVDPKVWKGLVGKKKNFWNSPGVVEDGIITAWDKNMSPVRFSMKDGISPLLTLILEGAKRELTVSAGSLVDYLNKYHGEELDPRHLELLKRLTDPSNPFARNLRVGFGVSRDGGMKGMYHYNSDTMTNTGIMMSPFSSDPSGRHWKLMDSPADMAPHFLHEISHAMTVFAYHSDPAIRQEVDAIHAKAVEAYKLKSQAHQLVGDFTLPTLHGLSNPLELLATVFHEQPLRDFLGSQQDTLGGRPTTLLGKLFDTIKRVMSKWLGKDQQGSLLDRLQQVTLETMQRQTDLYPKFGDIPTEPNLYGALKTHVFKKGQSDLMEDKPVDRSPAQPYSESKYAWANEQGEPLSEKQQSTLDAILSRNPELERQAKAATKQAGIGKEFAAKLDYLRKQGIHFNENMTSAIQAQHVREGSTLFSKEESDSINAGGGFKFGIAAYNPSTNTIGKHTLMKNGDVHISGLKNFGEGGRPLKDGEVELYKQLVPEAFVGGKVNVPKLVQGLKSKGPVVEVKKLGGQDSVIDAQQRRMDEVGHTLDTALGSQWVQIREGSNVAWNQLTPDQKALIKEYRQIEGRQYPPPVAARYSFVAPKPESEMPGYVEGLVRVPKRQLQPNDPPIMSGKHANELLNVKYSGPHFGSEDTNVLAFYRGYEETLPNGEKAFHVIEVQSDWGQQERPKKAAGLHNLDKTGHPLLSVYESLALKAAIAHAKEIGATKIILSDAETAMMSEGHDRNAPRRMPGNSQSIPELAGQTFMQTTRGAEPVEMLFTGRVVGDGMLEAKTRGGGTVQLTSENIKDPKILALIDKYYDSPRISQESGMRLHYDQTLPRELEKLTGSKGEGVELGQHKAAAQGFDRSGEFDSNRDANGNYIIEGSPVFRDPSGNPKIQITGKIFTLPEVPNQIRLMGSTLASRQEPRSPMPLIYSMGAHATHLSEIGDEVGVTPTNPTSFLKQFGAVAKYGKAVQDPTLGLRYLFSKDALSKLPDEVMAQIPQPPAHQWAYSLFNTVKELAIRRGDSPADAEALGHYVLATGAALKGSEDNVWLQGHDSSAYGRAVTNAQGKAFLGASAAVLFPGAMDTFERAGEVVRHEQYHTVQETQDVQQAMQTVSQLYGSLSIPERQALMWSLTNLSGRVKGTKYMDAMGTDTSVSEFGAQLFGRIGDHIMPLPRPNGYMQDMLRYAHDDISSMLRTLVVRRADSVNDLARQVEQTSTQMGVDGNKLMKVLDAVKATFKGMARDALTVEKDVSDFITMRNLFPDTYQHIMQSVGAVGDNWNILVKQNPSWGSVLPSRTTDIGKEVLRHIGLLQEAKGVDKPSLWTRKIGQFAHMVQEYPALRPFYDAIASAQGLARLASIQVQTALLGATSGDKLMDSSKVRMQNKFNSNAKLQEVFSKIAYQMQGEGDAAYEKALEAVGGDATQVPKQEVFDARKRAQLYDAAGVTSPEERKILEHVFEGTRNQVNVVNKIMGADQLSAVNIIAAQALMRNTNMTSEQARQASQLIHNAWEAQDKGDVDTALKLQAQFKQLVPDMKVQAQVFEFVRQSRDDIKQLMGMMNAKEPYFMSTRSPGRYAVYYKDAATGKLLHWYAKDSKALNDFITSKGISLSDPTTKLTYPNDSTQGLSPDIIQRANEGFDKVKGRLKGLFGEEEGAKLAQLMDWVSDYQNEFSSSNVLAMSKERRAVDPAHPDYQLRLENLNMFEAHQKYVRSVIQAAKNRQMKLEKELALADPTLRSQPVLRNIMEDHLAGVLKPDTELGRGIQLTNLVYFTSLAPVLAMIEPFQQLTAAVPQLIREGETIKGAWGRMTNANKLALGARLNKDTYADKDLDQAVKRARASGVIDRGLFAELDADHELQMTNRIRVSSGSKPLDLFDVVKSRMFQLGQTLVRWHGVVPAYNSEVAFVAAYKMYRESGRTPEQAFADARLFKDTTMLGGGKVNRPGVFAGQQSDFQRTAAQTMWSLQSYAVSQITLMGRLVKESMPGRGLTSAQSVQARKAAVAMLGTQLTLAGALGMPFVGGAIAILQKMFPQMQVEKDVREFLAHITGDSDAHGGWLGAALTTGIPSTLSQAPDVGARMSLSGVLGVSPYNGFSLQNIVGPTGSLIGNAFKAITHAAEGEPMQSAHDMMPRGFVRMWDAFQQGSEFRDPKGRLLANDLTPIETVMRGAGFTPARVGRMQTAERLATQALEANKADDAMFHSKQVELLVQGDADQVRMNLMQRAQQTGQNPVELANSVAQAYERQTMPVDPRSYVDRYSPQNTQVIQGQVGQQSSAPLPTQVERLTQKGQVLQSLGAPGTHPASMVHAQSVDHIMQMYPFMSPEQAAKMLQHHQSASLTSQP